MDSNLLSVYGMYPNVEGAENAIRLFIKAGFKNSDISAFFSSDDLIPLHDEGKLSKGPESALDGSVSAGAVVGGTIGWVAGASTILIPGAVTFLIAVPMIGLVAGAGGILGSIAGALLGTATPESDESVYENKIKSGSVLVSAHTKNDENTKFAMEIHESAGGDNITIK